MFKVWTTLIVVFLITQSQGCDQDRNKFKPIEVFSFGTNKFQVKDIIDSIVNEDTSFAFQELTDYMDTFIFERSFCLTSLGGPDSIKYFYYFSGDVREWLVNTDSTILILAYISINGKTLDARALEITKNKRTEYLLNLFKDRIVSKIPQLMSRLPRYDIRIIDSIRMERMAGMGVVCNGKGTCDTLQLKYIDAGKYTASPIR